MAAVAPAPVTLPATLPAAEPAAEPAAYTSPPGVGSAATGLLNGVNGVAAAEPPVTPTKAVNPPSVDVTPSVVSPADLKAVTQDKALTVQSYGGDSYGGDNVFTSSAKGSSPYLGPESTEWYVSKAIGGFLTFGFGLKDVLEDIYKRIRKYEWAIPDPEKTRMQVELQKYNRAVRAYNGACESINDRLKAPKMLVHERGSWRAKDIPSMVLTIAQLDDKEMTATHYKQILKECGCTDVRIPGKEERVNMAHGDRSRLRRQARKALGLAPFPLSVA